MKLFNGYVLGTSGGGKSFDVKVRKATTSPLTSRLSSTRRS